MALLNRMAAMAAAGLFCSAVGASAAVLIDLTDSDFITNGQYNVPITELESGIPGIKFSIAGSATPLRNDESGNQSPGGCLPGGAPLACDNDGFGIGDDEVTGENQSITLTFDGVVGFEKFYFLDLYYNVPTTDSARVARGTGMRKPR